MTGNATASFIAALTRTYHRLTSVSDQLHVRDGLTTGMRSILLLLHSRGDLTAAEIARDRAVTRQFIHRISLPLLERGLVQQMPNPRNKRSPKLALTAHGNDLVARIHEREAPLTMAMADAVDARDLSTVLDVFDRIGAVIDAHRGESG